jgi:hypothetical protein
MYSSVCAAQHPEPLSPQISVVDEKYTDLSDRVKRLETPMAARKRR